MEDPQQTEGCLARQGRLLGVDYGTVRIGIAVSDPEQKFSSPLTVYQRQDSKRMAIYFRDLVAAERIVGCVVGLPIHTSGAPSQKSLEATTFARWLQDQVQLPVVLYDERFTTAMARELLNQSNLSGKKRKERLDKIAAHVLLSSYLEAPDQAMALEEKSLADVSALSLEDRKNQS